MSHPNPNFNLSVPGPSLHHSTTPPLHSSWTRRNFLKTASTATLSALAAGFPRQLLAEPEEKIKPTADTVIILWMAGGMAHTETFDPKHYTPYEAGLKSDAILSTFPQIDTIADHIKLTEGPENIARVM